MPPALSIVVPVFNEQEGLRVFHGELSAALRGLSVAHEIIFVDDGSTDGSLAALAEIQKADPAASVVVLSRNFGQQAALTAGLELSKGQAVVMMDADLQHDPKIIETMLASWRRGAKVVNAVRRDGARESWAKRLTSSLYYRLINRLSDTPIRPDSPDFRLLDRAAVDALLSMKESHRFLRGMVGWLGLPQADVPFSPAPRVGGRPKYTWRKMAGLAADGIVSFSSRPLRLALWLGLFALAVNLCYAAYVLHLFFFYNVLIKGWASIILLTMFLGSSQLIVLGVVGEYIGRIYEQVKGRPLYLVRELRPGAAPSSSAPERRA